MWFVQRLRFHFFFLVKMRLTNSFVKTFTELADEQKKNYCAEKASELSFEMFILQPKIVRMALKIRKSINYSSALEHQTFEWNQLSYFKGIPTYHFDVQTQEMLCDF